LEWANDDLNFARQCASEEVGDEEHVVDAYMRSQEQKVKTIIATHEFCAAMKCVVEDLRDYLESRWKLDEELENPYHVYHAKFALKAIIRALGQEGAKQFAPR